MEVIFSQRIICVIMLDQSKILKQRLAVSKKTSTRTCRRSRPDLFLTLWHSELAGLLNKIGAFKI